MSQPPAKRFKQTTLLEGFSFTRKKSNELGSKSTVMDQGDSQGRESQQEKTTSEVEENDNDKANGAKSKLCDIEMPSTSGVCQGGVESLETLTGSPELFSDNSQDTVDEGCGDMDCPSQDSPAISAELTMTPPSEPKRGDHRTFGTPISEMNKNPGCSGPLPQMRISQSNFILFKFPLKCDDIPKPFPEKYRDKWDAVHVKMPCSAQSLYPHIDKGQKGLQNRWELIQLALKSDILNTYNLEEAILAYNSRYSDRWNFGGLHYFFKELEPEERKAFFDSTLPKMVNLALQIPYICTQAIPLLKKQTDLSVTMSQQQVACLLANAFFCTYPRRNARGKQSEYSSFPDINFNQLFAGSNKAEKIRCIMHYFRRVTTEMPTGTVTFQRQCLKNFPNWHKSRTKISNLHVTSSGTIEDDGTGMLQVDFANKVLGGGVLGHGCVQEEIRFLICPEMIVSRLITEILDENECLIMTGCEQFSSYTGYADTFKWNGDHIDTTPRDEWGRRCVQVVAIDALVIQTYKEQFRSYHVKRELNKAYCGFSVPSHNNKALPAVATGNWGCGAFGGETQLKALIQMMAASEAKRDVAYFTFNDVHLAKAMNHIYDFIMAKDLRVGDLWQLINKYWQDCCSNKQGRPNKTLYEYITGEYKPGEDKSNITNVNQRSASPDYSAETP